MPIFAFGKYKGLEYSEADEEYLQWMIDAKLKEIKGYQDELDRRAMAKEASLSMSEKIITAGYKALAMSLHPDKGGSTVQFQELKASYDQLKDVMNAVKASVEEK